MAGKPQLSDETVALIVEGHILGMGNREIASFAGIHHKTVAHWLKQLGLMPRIQRGGPPERVRDGFSMCSKCEKVVADDEFPYVQGSSDGRRLSYCRKCRYEQWRRSVGSTPERYFRHTEWTIRKNRRGHAVSLCDGYLAGLWYAQEGLCFYTDQPLRTALYEGRDPRQASADRVDCTIGYVEGNVVLCTDRVNTVKRDVTLSEMAEWMPGWHTRIVERLPPLVSAVVAAPVEKRFARVVSK